MGEKVLAGLFLLLLGALGAAAYIYRDAIRTYLGLQKSGAIDKAQNLVSAIEGVAESFGLKKPLS